MDIEDQLKELYVDQGLSIYETAEKLGIDIRKAKSIRKKLNIQKRIVAPLPDISKEDLYRLYIEENRTKKEIANLYNSPKSRVDDLIKLYEFKKSKDAIHSNQVKGIIKTYDTGEPQKKCRKTNLERYGVDCTLKNKDVKKKAEQTLLEKFGTLNVCTNKEVNAKLRENLKKAYSTGEPQKKYRQTCLEKYGVPSSSKVESIKNKMVKTYKERYLDVPEKKKKIQDKAYQTMKNNGTLNRKSSKEEDQIYELLLEKFSQEDVIRQYKSTNYPFPCDFYIKSLDLYIEYQGNRFHQEEPFDPTNIKHLGRLQTLKDRNTETSLRAIKTWTERDPLKRKVAKENNLNYLEIFGLSQAKEMIDKL